MHGPYRSLWLAVWSTVAVVGLCLGLLMVPVMASVVVFTLVAVLAGVATVGQIRSKGRGRPATGAELVRVTVTHAGAAGALALAAVGMGAVDGTLLVSLLMVAVVSSPWTVALIGRQLQEKNTRTAREGRDVTALPRCESARCEPDPDPVSRFALPDALQSLSDRELCRVWRVSFTALQEARTAVARERIYALRVAYLEELECRNAVAVGAWLAAGPRAAGGPDKYFTYPPEEHHRKAS